MRFCTLAALITQLIELALASSRFKLPPDARLGEQMKVTVDHKLASLELRFAEQQYQRLGIDDLDFFSVEINACSGSYMAVLNAPNHQIMATSMRTSAACISVGKADSRPNLCPFYDQAPSNDVFTVLNNTFEDVNLRIASNVRQEVKSMMLKSMSHFSYFTLDPSGDSSSHDSCGDDPGGWIW
jgi:hypothetical protein